jgi:hypothetical protein
MMFTRLKLARNLRRAWADYIGTLPANQQTPFMRVCRALSPDEVATLPAPRETRQAQQEEGQAAPSGNNATQGATTPTSQSKAAPID